MTSHTAATFRAGIDRYLEGDLRGLSVEQALHAGIPLVDVRTPEEFQQGAIPGAHNIPLFSGMERAEIGTLYKQVGPQVAVERGKDLVSEKIQEFLAPFSAFQKQPLIVYCARGGMRSASVVRLLQAQGHRAQQLHGGYKAYRNHVLQELEAFQGSFIVLHGQTGVGKTRILQRLPDHLDLEGLAQHRSSLFGALHLHPRTQRNFEGLLLKQIQALPAGRHWFIEGESRKVGPVFVPKAIFQPLREGITVLLEASLETRVQRTVEDYALRCEADVQEVDAILQTLKMALSAKVVEHLRLCLKQGRLEELAQILLTDYYDPRYQHAMTRYEYALRLSAEDLDAAAQALVEFRDTLPDPPLPKR